MLINNNEDKLFVGIDLHKNSSSFCVKDYEGNILRQEKVLTDKNQIRDFMLSLGQPTSVVLEPVSQWYTYADMLEQLGNDVHLAHPMKVKAIASARIKTDKIDANVLSDLLRANLLPEAYFASKEVRSWKELVRFRSGLILDEPFRTNLTEYLSLIDFLTKQIDEAEEQVEKMVASHPQAKLLTSIPGISYVSALTIIAEIGDINRFPSAKQLMGYAGLVPSTYSSGDTTRHGRITKTGNKWLRYIMTETAHHQVLCKRQPGFGSYYLAIKQRKGSGTAAVATARKLLAVVWRLLKDNREFQTMPPRSGKPETLAQ